MLTNSPDSYGAIAKILHWSIALLIVVLIVLGYWMVGLDYYDRWYNASLEWHKALGMITLGLVTARVMWRFCSAYPALAATLSAWKRRLATSVHHFLLLAMGLVPLTGYAISTSEGRGVSVFGWFELPAWLPRSEMLRELATTTHEWLAYITAAVIAIHAFAALKHHFIDRDDTLKRML